MVIIHNVPSTLGSARGCSCSAAGGCRGPAAFAAIAFVVVVVVVVVVAVAVAFAVAVAMFRCIVFSVVICSQPLCKSFCISQRIQLVTLSSQSMCKYAIQPLQGFDMHHTIISSRSVLFKPASRKLTSFRSDSRGSRLSFTPQA